MRIAPGTFPPNLTHAACEGVGGSCYPLPFPAWSPPGKRAAEFLAAAVLLVLAAPVLLLAAVAVRLSSRGPVIYSQVRVGLNGRPFTVYKLRTMFHGCEAKDGARWATPDDPRVTAIGAVLRRTHLDELPQLWNVLRGEMSLVGPRPERPEFVSKLERVIPRYRERLLVRPGITGLAQIQLPPDTDLESVRRKLAYDLFYVEKCGPWTDLRILVSTGLKVVRVPFPILRALAGIPRLEVVQRHYLHLAPPPPLQAQVQPA
jgi:lipopolysaccharide/colanic/teichoic acid biosynthesis glycosyltransferase